MNFNILGKLNKKIITATAVITIISLLTSGFGFFSNSNEYGKFVRVGDMHYPRSGHKAVLLQDGRVLIVGGGRKEAEIYDPKKRKFYLTGSMLENRKKNFTATLLQNGKVLVAGGRQGNKSLAGTELYNPETGMFEKSADMNFSRQYHTANLLQDGKVLILGGEWLDLMKKDPPLAGIIEQSEIYNPETEKFELGPELNIPRYQHTSINLPDGDVLIIAGLGKGYLSNIEKYNFKNNKFVNVGELSLKKRNTDCILLNDNELFVYGGNNQHLPDFGAIKDAEIFNLLSKNSSNIGKSLFVGRYPSIVKLPNNKILLSGGSKFWWGYKALKKTEIFDPVTNKFYENIDMIKPHAGHTMTLLNDGTVLIVGGWKTDKTFKYAELYVLNNK